MQELNMMEVEEVSGGGVFLAKVADGLAAAALPMIVFGPEASASMLFAASFFYASNAVFG